MSQEHVEIAHRFTDALNAREIPDGLLAPDFVLTNADSMVVR